MTVPRPRELGRAIRLDAPTTDRTDGAEPLEFTAYGGIADGVDAIVISTRAGMLIRAGLAVRALVIDVLLHANRSLQLKNRLIVLQAGIYRAI